MTQPLRWDGGRTRSADTQETGDTSGTLPEVTQCRWCVGGKDGGPRKSQGRAADYRVRTVLRFFTTALAHGTLALPHPEKVGRQKKGVPVAAKPRQLTADAPGERELSSGDWGNLASEKGRGDFTTPRREKAPPDKGGGEREGEG